MEIIRDNGVLVIKEQYNWTASQTLMVLAPASRIVKTKNFGIKRNRPHHSRKMGFVCFRMGELPVLCSISVIITLIS